MIRATVTKNNVITNQATFGTQQEAEMWVDGNKWAFGKPDRWLEPSDFTTETTQDATDSRLKYVDDIRFIDVYEYFFPSDYIVQYLDVTVEDNDSRAIELKLQDQYHGSKVIAKVKSINERKNLNLQGLQAILADPTLAIIERLLWQGSVLTALGFIVQLDTNLFTAEEKEEIINFITGLGYEVP